MTTPTSGEPDDSGFFDASPLALSLDVSAVPRQPTGAGRYVVSLATSLAGRDDVTMTLWCRRRDGGWWRSVVERGRSARRDHAGAPKGDRGGVVRPEAPRSRPWRLAWEQLRLPGLLADGALSVHHGPHYTMPERARLPKVVTIHDLTLLEHPEWHERSKVAVFRRAIEVAARRADALVCVSDRTAQRLRDRCRPRGRVFVVPHGVDHDRFRPGEDAPGSDGALIASLGVQPPYVLFLGTTEPRKDLPSLVAAFDRVAEQHRDLTLVIAGRPGWGTMAVERALAGARHDRRVVRLGYVEDDAVPALLRGAAVVAYPAIEEGFGLPAVEALACGAPLVTTSGTAMADAAGTAAVLVAPRAPGELADAIDAVLSGGRAVEDRRRLGLESAARFTWTASAEGHMAAYRWAVDRADARAAGSTSSDDH